MSMVGRSWRPGRRRKAQRDYYRERRARRRRQVARSSILPVSVAVIADRDHLYECYQELRREGGQAPGIDGVTYTHLSNSEAAEIMGGLSRALLDGTYRPHPTREVRIPKPGTDQTRPLRLGTICDRVVGKALTRVLGPVWERIFLPCSWGFRPRRSPWQMLAALATLSAYL